METSRFAEESGPTEDLQLLIKPTLQKVIDVECPEVIGFSGVLSVERTDPLIARFLKCVPFLINPNETHGLIWDTKLKPENCMYEKGLHFVSTREKDRKTTHAAVSFYRDGVTGAKFAIKTLMKGTDFHPKEIEVGMNIQHQNICSVYGIIIRNGSIHILLEHAGSPLYDERAWIADSPKRMKSFAKQSFQALNIIHSKGFVHCDIKPDNIMIHRHDGNEFTVKLIDFGTCHNDGASLPSTAHTTLLYWSPEIWQAHDRKSEIICTPAMDVYALALTLHFVHTSLHLTERFEIKDLKNLMIKTPEDILFIALPETIPPDLSVVMRSCLDGNHKSRTSALEAFNQLADDVLTRWSASNTKEENYKETFDRIICSSINNTARHSSTDTANTVFKSPIVSHNTQEKVAYVGGSIGTEKRECRTVSKSRKTACFSGNKFSKPSQKGKKCTRLQSKLSLQKMSQISPETFQSPLVSPDGDLEKGVEIKSDDKVYCYSNLLKNLALHIREPHQAATFNTHKSSEKSGIVQLLMRDETKKVQGKPMETGSKWTVNQPIDRSYRFSGDKPESEIQDICKIKNKNEVRLVGKSGSAIEVLHMKNSDVNCSPLIEVQSITEPCSRMDEDQSKKSCESSDDMDYVFKAFDDNAFTGADDDVVNHMFMMLDKNEQTQSSSPSGTEMVISTHEIKTSNHNQTSVITEEEPMDAVDIDESDPVSIVNKRKKLNLPAVKVNRKRIAESPPSSNNIPGKAVFSPPSQGLDLPNFDQILPENI